VRLRDRRRSRLLGHDGVQRLLHPVRAARRLPGVGVQLLRQRWLRHALAPLGGQCGGREGGDLRSGQTVPSIGISLITASVSGTVTGPDAAPLAGHLRGTTMFGRAYAPGPTDLHPAPERGRHLPALLLGLPGGHVCAAAAECDRGCWPGAQRRRREPVRGMPGSSAGSRTAKGTDSAGSACARPAPAPPTATATRPPQPTARTRCARPTRRYVLSFETCDHQQQPSIPEHVDQCRRRGRRHDDGRRPAPAGSGISGQVVDPGPGRRSRTCASPARHHAGACRDGGGRPLPA
jgi:hypothetical protein